jgi:hypothetical protein
MTADELRKYITAVPFLPFSVRTIDGRLLPVYNRDFILISPPQQHVYVFKSDGGFEVFDINLLPGVVFDPPQPTPISNPSDTTA